MDNEELTLFRDMARRALEKEISPHIEEWEAQHMVPRELWNTLGAAGLLCPDMPGRARRAEELGVDYIIVHTGFDERNMIAGLSPLNDLPGILAAVDIPVQAVGGLSIDQAIQTLEMGAEIVVFGAPLVISGTEFKPADPDFEPIIRNIVERVKKIKVGGSRG